MDETTVVRRISTSTVKPEPPPENRPRLFLTPWDLPILSVRYIQKGLLFRGYPESLVDRLKISLSQALAVFDPLAGRLVTESDGTSSLIYIDCSGAGAEFIHAEADVAVADVLSPDVPPVVQSFFPLNEAVNHDGHSLPVLAVQLTRLRDGFFLACSFNHAGGDGTAFWQFYASWAETTKHGTAAAVSRQPVVDRPFFGGGVRLPFGNPNEFIKRLSLPPLRDRFFHFSRESVSRLKAQANYELKTDRISSFQALAALSWRAITRAIPLPPEAPTTCNFSVDCRLRLQPPLSRDYFSNAIGLISASATAGELLGNGLGWAALRLHEKIASHTDAVVRERLEEWVKAPKVYQFGRFHGRALLIGSSPRFGVYGVDFGWGKAEAVPSGIDNKFNAKITAFPGREGMGSVDLEICLTREEMAAQEVDVEFMAAVC